MIDHYNLVTEYDYARAIPPYYESAGNARENGSSHYEIPDKYSPKYSGYEKPVELQVDPTVRYNHIRSTNIPNVYHLPHIPGVQRYITARPQADIRQVNVCVSGGRRVKLQIL